MAGVAIVTGGASGIGAAITSALLEKGYKVCIAEIDEASGINFVGTQQALFGEDKVTCVKCDVTREDDIRRAFDVATEKLGKVSLLVNNAGIVDERDPQNVINVNVMGPIFGCRVAIEYMGKSKGGEGGMVINTASISGLIGTQYYFPSYVASKHAVVGLTRSYGMPYHLEKEGVLFSAFCPSFTRTPLLPLLQEQTGLDVSEHPSMMTAEYVAGGFIKLLEDQINGSTLLVSKEMGYRYIECQEDLKALV